LSGSFTGVVWLILGTKESNHTFIRFGLFALPKSEKRRRKDWERFSHLMVRREKNMFKAASAKGM